MNWIVFNISDLWVQTLWEHVSGYSYSSVVVSSVLYLVYTSAPLLPKYIIGKRNVHLVVYEVYCPVQPYTALCTVYCTNCSCIALMSARYKLFVIVKKLFSNYKYLISKSCFKALPYLVLIICIHTYKETNFNSRVANILFLYSTTTVNIM